MEPKLWCHTSKIRTQCDYLSTWCKVTVTHTLWPRCKWGSFKGGAQLAKGHTSSQLRSRSTSPAHDHAHFFDRCLMALWAGADGDISHLSAQKIPHPGRGVPFCWPIASFAAGCQKAANNQCIQMSQQRSWALGCLISCNVLGLP